MTAPDHPLLRLVSPSPAQWGALPPVRQRAVLGQLEQLASRRVGRDLGRLLAAPWWAALADDDATRAARVVAYASACADGAQPRPDEPCCRRTILDNTLDSLLPPHGCFSLAFEDLPHEEGRSLVAGLCVRPSAVVLNRRIIAAGEAPVGEGPHGWLEARVATSTLAHEVNHLHNAVPPGPTYAAFMDEYRAWTVDFVVAADRPPRRVEALERCCELLTSPGYAALGQAVAARTEEGERILAFLRAFGPVARLEDLLGLPREGFLEPAPLPRPPRCMTNAPPAARGAGAAIDGSA